MAVRIVTRLRYAYASLFHHRLRLCSVEIQQEEAFAVPCVTLRTSRIHNLPSRSALCVQCECWGKYAHLAAHSAVHT